MLYTIRDYSRLLQFICMQKGLFAQQIAHFYIRGVIYYTWHNFNKWSDFQDAFYLFECTYIFHKHTSTKKKDFCQHNSEHLYY